MLCRLCSRPPLVYISHTQHTRNERVAKANTDPSEVLKKNKQADKTITGRCFQPNMLALFISYFFFFFCFEHRRLTLAQVPVQAPEESGGKSEAVIDGWKCMLFL